MLVSEVRSPVARAIPRKTGDGTANWEGRVVQIKCKKSKAVHTSFIFSSSHVVITSSFWVSFNKHNTGPLDVPYMGNRSGSQALGCQLLCIVPVLVDLCQRAHETGPLIVSWNCNLLWGRAHQRHYSNYSGTRWQVMFYMHLSEQWLQKKYKECFELLWEIKTQGAVAILCCSINHTIIAIKKLNRVHNKAQKWLWSKNKTQNNQKGKKLSHVCSPLQYHKQELVHLSLPQQFLCQNEPIWPCWGLGYPLLWRSQ